MAQFWGKIKRLGDAELQGSMPAGIAKPTAATTCRTPIARFSSASRLRPRWPSRTSTPSWTCLGLDLIFIGPNDLHLSLGLVPRYWSDEPAYRQAVERVAAGCRARNLPLGTLCLNADAVQARRADGYTFLGMGSDAGYLLGAVGAEYGKIFDQSPRGRLGRRSEASEMTRAPNSPQLGPWAGVPGGSPPATPAPP